VTWLLLWAATTLSGCLDETPLFENDSESGSSGDPSGPTSAGSTTTSAGSTTASAGSTTTGDEGTALPKGWRYRIKITFNTTEIHEDLDDAPVLITLDESFPYGHAASDGADLRFTDSDGVTLIPHEFDPWQVDAISRVWVRVPRLDGESTSDHVWVYYGNPDATHVPSQYVWTADYYGVWHLGQLEDSSAQGRDAMSSEGAVPALGLIGGAYEFNGAAYIDLPPALAFDELSTSQGHASLWVRTDATFDEYAHILYASSRDDGDGNDEDEFHVHLTDETALKAYACCNAETELGPLVNDNAWHHILLSWDIADEDPLRLFLDGAQVLTIENDLGTFGFTSLLRLGRPGKNTRHYEGLIDELRISSTPRSRDAATLEHFAALQPSSFLTFSAEAQL
jgi:hypothetical protein